MKDFIHIPADVRVTSCAAATCSGKFIRIRELRVDSGSTTLLELALGAVKPVAAWPEGSRVDKHRGADVQALQNAAPALPPVIVRTTTVVMLLLKAAKVSYDSPLPPPFFSHSPA